MNRNIRRKAPKWSLVYKSRGLLYKNLKQTCHREFTKRSQGAQIAIAGFRKLLHFLLKDSSFVFPHKIPFALYSMLFLGMLYAEKAKGQEISRTFTKELSVAPNSHIVSKGPRHMTYESSGRMSSSTKDNVYTLIPGGNDNVPALIVKDYQVFTWKENKIRQEVTISVIPDEKDPQEAQKLMDKLKIRLTLHADGSIPIDDNLNIAKFGFVNGFFTRNTNTVTLENGEKFRVKSLIISSQIHIPSNANLTLSSELVGVSIGDLEGNLALTFQGGTIRGGKVKSMQATLLYAKAIFKNLGNVTLNSQVSSFTADKVDTLLVGSDNLAKLVEVKGSLFKKGRLSTATTYKIAYAGNVVLDETVNDKFYLETVGIMDSRNSTFSNYEIGVLKHALQIRAKNGDLNIKAVSKGFTSLQIENKLSEIEIGLGKTEDYLLEIFDNSYTEYVLPDHLSHLPNAAPKPYLKGKKEKAGKISIGCESCKISLKE